MINKPFFLNTPNKTHQNNLPTFTQSKGFMGTNKPFFKKAPGPETFVKPRATQLWKKHRRILSTIKKARNTSLWRRVRKLRIRRKRNLFQYKKNLRSEKKAIISKMVTLPKELPGDLTLRIKTHRKVQRLAQEKNSLVHLERVSVRLESLKATLSLFRRAKRKMKFHRVDYSRARIQKDWSANVQNSIKKLTVALRKYRAAKALSTPAFFLWKRPLHLRLKTSRFRYALQKRYRRRLMKRELCLTKARIKLKKRSVLKKKVLRKRKGRFFWEDPYAEKDYSVASLLKKRPSKLKTHKPITLKVGNKKKECPWEAFTSSTVKDYLAYQQTLNKETGNPPYNNVSAYFSKMLRDCYKLNNDLNTLNSYIQISRLQLSSLNVWHRFWSRHRADVKKVLANSDSLHLSLIKASNRLLAQPRAIAGPRGVLIPEKLPSFLYNLKLQEKKLKVELMLYTFFKIRSSLHRSETAVLSKAKTMNKYVKWFLERKISEKFFRRKKIGYHQEPFYKKLKLWVRLMRKTKSARKKRRRKERWEQIRTRGVKKYNALVLKHMTNTLVERTSKQRFHRKTVFINYYRYVDGVYNSYWFGKFTNMFIKKGKKRTASENLHSVFIAIRHTYNLSMFHVLLGALKKLRSVFKLRKYKVRKGREIKEYPVLTKVTLLYIHVLIKIKKRIIKAHYPVEKMAVNKRANRGLRIHSIRETIKRSLVEYATNQRKHVLVKERRAEVKNSVHFMINRRFNKKKR